MTQLRKAIHESEEELTKKDNLKDLADLPGTEKKEDFVDMLLTNHSLLKAQVDEIMNSVTSSNFEVHQILNKSDLGKVGIFLNLLYKSFSLILESATFRSGELKRNI